MVSIRTIDAHNSRIGAIAWKDNVLASGSKDYNIFLTDMRSKNQYNSKLVGHKQEICGLSFNHFDNKLASGGNDNKLIVWDCSKGVEMSRFSEHKAAIKALDWSPHQNGLLASGGGSSDKTIKLWNVKTGYRVHSVDTGSQVCALKFSKSVNELVSTHGFSRNQIEIWKTPDMLNIATLNGHRSRVLYLDDSPSGESIVTASADETLRFWNIFPSAYSNQYDIFNKSAFSNILEIR